MRSIQSFPKILIYRQHVDFRKQINGLAALIESALQQSPFGECLYVFANRSRSQLKMLYWDRTGFALWQKRLEKDRFPWPSPQHSIVPVTARQLTWLLDGINIFAVRAHDEVRYEFIS